MRSPDNRFPMTLVFLRDGDKILLAMKKRRFGEGKWNGVGGKLEPGETIEQAAIRETQEEINVTIDEMHPVGVLYFTQEPYLNNNSNVDVHVFVADKWTGEPVETEEMKPQWFNVDDVPFDNMWPDDPFWLPYVIEGKTVEGDFLFNEAFDLVDHDVRVTSEVA